MTLVGKSENTCPHLSISCLMFTVGVGTGDAAGPKISFAFCTQHPMWCPALGKKADGTVTTHRS